MITQNSKFSEITPLELALFCQSTYVAPNTIISTDGHWSVNIVECVGGRVVGFSGTKNIQNWVSDAGICMREVIVAGKKIRVHSGLWGAWLTMRQAITDYLYTHPGRTLWTGHSAGGAFAVYAAMEFAGVGQSYASTFDHPRCLDRGGAALCNRLVDLVRFVNGSDIVAHLPLPRPWSLTSYWHAGEERYLMPGGRVLVNPTKWYEMTMDALALWNARQSGPLALEALFTDHFIANIIERLREVEEAQRTGETSLP